MKVHEGRFTTRWILLVAIFLAAHLPQAGFAQTAATYHARADQALQSFLIKFWSGGSQYLRERYPDNGSLTGYWTYANGWDALLDGVERTGGQQYAGLIESFYRGQNQRGWYVGYYDDECWMTLALIRAYDLTTNVTYLNQAQALYADIESGWDDTCCGPNVGGVWWDKAHTQKATASNAGATIAGTRLYLRTTNITYLNFAVQIYSFWFTNMVNQSTFQVADHITTGGSKVFYGFTYNEGLMIGASVELNEATGTAAYLTKGYNIANYMITHEVTPTAYGNVLYDVGNSTTTDDAHEFKGPSYRYLMRLYQKDTSKTQYYNVLKASANAIWNLARDTNRTVFAVNWAGPTQTNVDQQQDNAACMGLNLFAGQFGAYPGSGIPAGQYEAENATIRNIPLEASYTNFTGWGYLAGWNANGQSVDFHVNFSDTGGRTLTFRYAAGAGDASRLISVNGSNTFPNQAFSNTGSWNNYNTVSVSCNFPAGTNTISVAYNSALGNGNYLNLDNLVISDLRITGLTAASGGPVLLTWNAVAGQTYHVQSMDSLRNAWNTISGTVTATTNTASFIDSTGNLTQRFYRVIKP